MHVDRTMSRPLSGCSQIQHVYVGTRFESLAAAGKARQQVVCTVVVYVPPKHMWCPLFPAPETHKEHLPRRPGRRRQTRSDMLTHNQIFHAFARNDSWRTQVALGCGMAKCIKIRERQLTSPEDSHPKLSPHLGLGLLK